MDTSTQSLRRLALFAGAAAVVTMGLLSLGATVAKTNGSLPGSALATHAGVPLAPGDSGGEITRGNQSGSFAPTSTNDLITQWAPVPGSPWRD